MTNGVKSTQHQIDGIRREKIQRKKPRPTFKFPIVNMDKGTRNGLLIMFLIIMLGSALVSCKKDPLVGYTDGENIPDVGICIINDVDPMVHSDWKFKLNEYYLRHTDGLIQMALSGSHAGLAVELCSDESGSIPAGLGDFENAKYAPIRDYYGFRVAMYHPTELYPDNWIIFDPKTGDWKRFDLGPGGITEIRRGNYPTPPNN